MIEPEHPTEKYIQGRISFHESQAEWFDLHDKKLAVWARSVADSWRKKLKTTKPDEPQ